MMRTANPALNANSFNSVRGLASGNAMTIQGTVNKTFVILVLLMITASWVWGKAFSATPMFEGVEGEVARKTAGVGGAVMLGLFGGLIAALVTVFKKTWAPISAPIYALFQGLALGGISAFFEMRYPGIVVQAVALTFGILFSLLMAYKSGLIKATENFKLGVTAATGGIFIVYMVNFIMGFFGGSISVLSVQNSSMLSIGVSLFIVVIAALNLVLDFDFIEKGSEMGVPKYMEWYGAFGLMVTLVWLYLEILRLLAKLSGRR